MPGNSGLPVAFPNGIDGSVTNKLTFAVLEGSAAYSMKYPGLQRYDLLQLLGGCHCTV